MHLLAYICLKPTYIHVSFWYIFQSCESILAFSSGSISPNQRNRMSDKEVLKSRGVLQSHTANISEVLLQRAEEIFSALKESTVSVVCMN